MMMGYQEQRGSLSRKTLWAMCLAKDPPQGAGEEKRAVRECANSSYGREDYFF